MYMYLHRCLGQTENASRTELCRGLSVLAPGTHPHVALSVRDPRWGTPALACQG